MNKLNLMLHAGAAPITREQVAEIATPAGTATHYPIPHRQLIDEV